ncbi:MAG TPA: AAA family ATPase [Puia sp.]|jgi:NadR type nicotinamide-nucleotide adenylyltransferase
MPFKLKKIVVIGPESTGKSTLCEGLAAHYHTDWVPEYAREYLLAHGMNYRYEDLLTIARGQVQLEETRAAALVRRLTGEVQRDEGLQGRESLRREKILFIDTDLYVMKVWSEFVFGRCDPWILEQIAIRRYDGYLLCRTDLPWVKDELREYPDLVNREKLFHIYRDCLVNQSTPWMEVGGCADKRLGVAIGAVNELDLFH